jgi:peptidoglycan/LPS O-acetylase OafA/YrhL
LLSWVKPETAASSATNVSRPAERYFPGIDGLRAVAVVSVILYHLHDSLLPGGFTGVDVFFAISGYVVSRSLARDGDYPLPSFLLRFYARRVLRILPALLVCLLVTTAATIIFIPIAWLSGTTQKTALAAFFGMSNFALLSSDPYFSPRPGFNPFTQTWSLAVEEQFYLFYPLILFVTFRLGRRRGLLGVAAKALLPLLLIVSFLALWWISGINRDAAFYMLPYRFWELAAGAVLFMLQRRGILRLVTLGRLASWAGAVLVLATAWYADWRASPFPWSVPAVVGSVLVIAALTTEHVPSTLISRLLGSRPVVFVGKLSYSLYLWHWAVFVLFRWTIGLDATFNMVAAVALTLALAYASYIAVEQPFRRGQWVRAQPNWRVMASAFASVTLSWAITHYAFASQGQLSASVVMRNSGDWYPMAPQRKAGLSCDLEWRPTQIDQALLLTLRRPCGTPAWARRMFVIGDSHAAAYFPMLTMLAQQENTDVRVYLHSGCSYANMLAPTPPMCRSFVSSTSQSVLSDAQPGDMVFLASLRMPRLGDQYTEVAASIHEMLASQAAPEAVDERSKAYDETAALVAQFAAKQLTIIFDAPKPVFRAAAFRCADWFDRHNPMCQTGLAISRSDLLALRQPIMDSLTRLSAAYSAVAVWDPFPVLCGTAICRAITESGPLFFDGDHLSNIGNRVLYPNFASFVRQISEHRTTLR